MNKIFRVVWNHATQSWVAVSELASAKGKTKSKTAAKLTALSLVAGSALVAGNAMAAVTTISIDASVASPSVNGIFIAPNGSSKASVQTDGTSAAKNVIVIGNRGTSYDDSIVIGNDITSNNSGRAADTIVGNHVRYGGGGADSMSTAVGYATQVAGPSVAMGVGARADIGDASGWNAVKNGGVAIGGFASIGGNQDGGVAIGAISQADQNGSVAVGQLSGAFRQAYDRDIIWERGGRRDAGKIWNLNENGGNVLTSIGQQAGARGGYSVAIGPNALTSRDDANGVAIGNNAMAIKSNSIALGNNAVAGGYEDTTPITSTLAKRKKEYEDILKDVKTRKAAAEAAVAADGNSENKFILADLNAIEARVQLAIDRIDRDMSKASTDKSNTTNAIAIGNESKATNASAIATGNKANASGEAAMAQGENSVASGKRSIAQGKNANATGEDAVAQGTDTKSEGAYAIALGRRAEATKNFTIAQGNTAKATEERAIAIGNQANATATRAIAFGNETSANIAYGVALGSNSQTTADKGIAGFNPANQGSADIRANHYAGLAGRVATSTLAGVSIGSASNTRQINHLAAGTADDDAVNVAQLRSVNLKIEGNTLGQTASAAAAANAVQSGATSKADVLLDSQTLKVVSSNTDLLTTDATNNTITITPKTATINVDTTSAADSGNRGKAQVPDSDGLVSAKALANTLNNLHWNVQASKDDKGDVSGNETKDVKAGDLVRLIAGEGVKIAQNGRDFTFSVKNVVQMTKSDGSSSFFRAGPNMEVTLAGEGKDQHIEYKLSPDININSVTTAGGAKLEGKALSGLDNHLVPATPYTTVGTLPASVTGDKLDEAATVNDVLNAGWNLQNNGNAVDFVKPYETVNFVDGGNTRAVAKTTDNLTSNVQINVTGLPVSFTATVNGQEVPVAKVGDNYYPVDANGNPDTTQAPIPAASLNSNMVNPAAPSNAIGAPTKLGNVAAGAETFEAPKDASGNPLKLANDGKWYPADQVGANGKPNDGATPVANPPVTADNPTAGLINFENSNPNNAATVGDLQNLGWVVSAKDGNGYTDQVRNANKVDFKGTNGISVTGETLSDGTRQITVAIEDGEVRNDFTISTTDPEGNVTNIATNAVQGPDGNYYQNDGNGRADLTKPIAVPTGATITNNGQKVVTGKAVAKAIQESGWNVGKATAEDVKTSADIEASFSADAKVYDKVNPNDDVKFVDGNNTTVKLVTVDSQNDDGTKKATTFVKVDVSGLPVQYTDQSGAPVIKVGDKFFTVDENGNPTAKEVNPSDISANVINPTAKPNKKGDATTLGNIKNNLPTVNDADKTAADKDGNAIAGQTNVSAPISAADAAKLSSPTIKNADGKDVPNPDYIGNNAATVSDVLNAGWNLQNNNEARDFVKPYDTVNFVDGAGTTAVVETAEDGLSSKVKFDIATGKITNNADGTAQGPVVTPELTKALTDATATLNALPQNAPPAVRKAAEEAVAKAANDIANVANRVATAQDVANAINNSGFTLTTSAVDNGKKVSGSPEMINPGKKVEMVAGKNMTVKQEANGKITYATADDVEFNSVQFGANGPKITNNGGNINVGTATGAPTKITGVAPGRIAPDSTDAVNGSQLYAVAKDINKLGKRLDAGMATSAAMANLLQPHKPGQSVATAGVGQHRNQSAVAVGYSRLSDNGKYGVRFSMGANTQGEVTGGAAVGYFW